MNARELLSDAWCDLTRHQPCTGPAAQAVLDELVQAYSEPHRHYHTFEHVAALLRLLEKYGGEVLDRNALALAILFHDVIYDPGPPTTSLRACRPRFAIPGRAIGSHSSARCSNLR